MGAGYWARFDNELGNAIRLSMAVSDPTMDGVGKVRITITGPDSQSENLLTMREAMELRKALARLPDDQTILDQS